MEKYQAINIFEHPSLDQLDWQSGELVGFDNRSMDGAGSYFVLTIPIRITRESSNPALSLTYKSQQNAEERWQVETSGIILALNPPYKNRNHKFQPETIILKGTYEIEYAYAGNEAVEQGLRTSPGMEFYADLLKQGIVVTERNSLEKIVAKLGGEKLLLPLPRIGNYLNNLWLYLPERLF